MGPGARRRAPCAGVTVRLARAGLCGAAPQASQAAPGLPLHGRAASPARLQAREERPRRECLGTKHPSALPGALIEQLERDHGVDRGLPHDGLASVLAHRLLVVHHVVEVCRPRLAVGAGPRHPRPRAGATGHPLPQRRRIGQRGGDHVAGRDLRATHRHRLGRVQAKLVQRAENLDELLAEPVLEGDPPALHPAGDQHHLLVLDVHALHLPDPLRELEHLGLRERRGRVEAALALPDERRVQALLDRRPDREGGREVIALHDEIRPVAHPDLLHAREQLLRRRRRRTRPRGPAPHRSPPAQQPGLLPRPHAAPVGTRRASSPGSSYGRSG